MDIMTKTNIMFEKMLKAHDACPGSKQHLALLAKYKKLSSRVTSERRKNKTLAADPCLVPHLNKDCFNCNLCNLSLKKGESYG